MIHILLGNQGSNILVHNLAKKLDCSEKTVRNDFKIIEAFLEGDYQAQLVRKPGVGVILEVEAEAEVQLYKLLQETNELKLLQTELSENDVLNLTYHFLIDTDPTTIHTLATNFYVTKAVMKKTIAALEIWFKKRNLLLISKQKIGIYLSGEEKDKRTALANLDELRSNTENYHPFIYRYFLAHEIDIARSKFKKFQEDYILFFTDESFENIIVHLLLMTKRTKMKQLVTLTSDEVNYLKKKQEYQSIKKLTNELATIFRVKYPDVEIAYLTMHVLGAKIHHQKEDPQFLDLEMEQRVIKISDHLTKRITILSLIPFEQDNILREGLRVHLYTTFNRLKFSLHVTNPLAQDIKKMYPYLFDMLLFLLKEMEEEILYEIPEDEIAYLTLHYQAAIERIQRKQVKVKQIVIVCHMGIGVSEILRTKIERKFPNIVVLATISRRDLFTFISEHTIDLIVTTTPIELKQPKHIVVSPLFDTTDEKKFNRLLHVNQKELNHQPSRLGEYINPAYVFLQVEMEHRFQLIEQVTNRLYLDGFVEEDYAHQALIRERTSATAIGGGIAIPHGDPNLVKQSTIAVITLKHPLEWEGEKVSMVFLLAVKNEVNFNRRELFQRLTVLAEQPTLVQQLIKETDKKKFLMEL